MWTSCVGPVVINHFNYVALLDMASPKTAIKEDNMLSCNVISRHTNYLARRHYKSYIVLMLYPLNYCICSNSNSGDTVLSLDDVAAVLKMFVTHDI